MDACLGDEDEEKMLVALLVECVVLSLDLVGQFRYVFAVLVLLVCVSWVCGGG